MRLFYHSPRALAFPWAAAWDKVEFDHAEPSEGENDSILVYHVSLYIYFEFRWTVLWGERKKRRLFVEIGLHGSSLLNLEAIATLTTNFPCGGLLCEG